ncbi:MAG: SprB repeat-containing protein [Bacteroidetes bacterium]|nr:SprB repeat-containing protein [Bacteroidota bacterium]
MYIIFDNRNYRATPYQYELQATPVSCYQASDGQLTALPVGGTASFTYLWSNSATTQTINGLAVGTYTVTVTDAHGCPTTKSITITQPTQLAPTCSGTNVNCFGGNNGSATVTATGGTAPYTYLWSNGKTTAANNNIAAGTYTATVTDANGCAATCAYTVTQPTQLVATCAGTNLNCFGGNNGSATVTASGGIAPYTYLWNTNAATSTITSLPTGTYIVTATDDNGCTATSYVIIAQPAQLTISFSQTNLPGCIGSNFGVNTVVTGGTQPFTYNWSNGANTANLTNLDPNISNYTLIVNDANGCSMLEPFTLQNDNTCCGIFTNNFSTTNGNPPAFTENLNADLVVNGTLTLTNSTLDIYSGVK